MGWFRMPLSSMYPHRTAKDYLDAQYNWSRDHEDGSTSSVRVLASCLRNRVYYAAVVPARNGIDGPATAVICLVRWSPRDKDGDQFGYKSMDEDMGPYQTECPERILALLGETDHPHALVWRRRCLETLALSRRPLEHGMKIRLAEPISFTDGYEGDEFTVHKQGRKICLAPPGCDHPRYRISNLKMRAWTHVLETRVHKTVFT